MHPRTPTPAEPPPSDRGSAAGLASAFGISGAAAAAALYVGGAGPVVGLAFPVVALVVAARLLGRSSAAYLEFVVWLWLLTPGLRRVIDSASGWHELSPVMVVAPLATLIALPAALRGRRPMPRPLERAFVVALAAIAYGVVVGVVRWGPASPLAALLVWLPPIVLGLYVATAGPSTRELAGVVRRTAVVGSLVLGAYGLVQYFVLPVWDRMWMEQVQMASIGLPVPTEVRVFSLLNSPGPFATVLGVLLVLLVAVPGRGRAPAAIAGVAGFGLSLVRMAWLGLAGAVLALVAARGAGRARAAVMFLAVPVMVLLAVDGPVSDVVMERITSSVEHRGDDVSVSARSDTYRQLLPALATDVVGGGLGSTGVSTKVANDGQLGQLADVDSALLDYLATFGGLVGSVALATTAAAAVSAYRRSKAGGDLARASGAAAVGVLVQVPFGNPLISVSGVFFWLLVAVALRDDEHDDGAAPATTSPDLAMAPA